MEEDGFAFLRKSHGGCDSPPDCRQDPPFESVLQIPITTKKTNPFGLVFFVSMGYKKDIFCIFAYEFEPLQFLHKNIRLVTSCDDMLFF